MNIPAAYTPLESLFLFQSLLAHGVDDEAFARISELLKNNALIRSGGTYDPGRLSPGALRELFLLLLRDELRGEAEQPAATAAKTTTTAATATTGVDGSGSPATKKRKLGTLPLPTLKDVYENAEKVPALVDRLYARYREFMVNSIREDERKFANVQKEIQLLERSEKERLAKVARQNGPPNLVSRDPKAVAAGPGAATPNGPSAVSPGPGPPGPVAPALAGGRAAPNTPIMPPKSSAPATIAAPKDAPPPHLAPRAQPQRTIASPKPPHGVASVLQAPAGAPPQQGARALQPPAQSPKQVLSPRIESSASPNPADAAATSQATPHVPAGGALKWEKPYQPPPQMQSPQTGQFTPTIPPNAPVHQKVQQQSQWSQQQAHAQSQASPNQQQQPQFAPHQHGQMMHPQIQQPPQARPSPAKAGLASPQQAAQLVPPFQPGPRPVGSPQPRPPSAAQGRAIQPQQSFQPYQNQRPHAVQQASQGTHAQQPHVPPVQKPPLSQLAQKFQQQKSPPVTRPLAVATASKVANGHGAVSSQVNKGSPGSVAQQRWSQNQHGTPSPVTPTASRDKSSAYAGQQPRPAIPEHIIRQAVTPGGPARKSGPASPAPRLAAPSSPVSVKRGFGTKWASYSTPSTPDPTVSEPQSPAFEPVSPPHRPIAAKSSSTQRPVPASHIAKTTSKGDVTPVSKGRGRPPRTVQRGRGSSATPSAPGTRRSQSAASQTDELSLDHSVPAPKVKKEVVTPRLREETGDTTADESVYGRGGVMVTPGSISRVSKRKRQDTVDLTGPPTHVHWTRGFTKVSSSALDQISSHRDANMFATALRERDAPNYRQIVLQPQDITSIRSAIKQGNKAAQQAANNLLGGDPGTAAIWLPISDDLVPPRGIINSAHLERELVHMFCNAIMYNPDPDRGPGPSFLKRSKNSEEGVVGYRLDENGVVKNTRSMFVEVEKLLGDLRAAEKDRGIPPMMSVTRQGSVATPADDTAEEEDELAADGDTVSVPGTVKRRRINTRS